MRVWHQVLNYPLVDRAWSWYQKHSFRSYSCILSLYMRTLYLVNTTTTVWPKRLVVLTEYFHLLGSNTSLEVEGMILVWAPRPDTRRIIYQLMTDHDIYNKRLLIVTKSLPEFLRFPTSNPTEKSSNVEIKKN